MCPHGHPCSVWQQSYYDRVDAGRFGKVTGNPGGRKNSWRKAPQRVIWLTAVDTMKITDVLRAEHAVFHNLFDHIEAALPRIRTLAEVKSLATVVETLLAPHAKTEDDLFMEPLEHCFDQIGQQETFHDEHELIDAELAKVHQARELKAAKKILLGAVTASRKHFDKEERIVFPLAERILKAKTLSELGEQWLNRRDVGTK